MNKQTAIHHPGPVIHYDLEQGTDEWLAARTGLLTASEMSLILTPKLKIASNDKERTHLYELLSQRINKYVEPQYLSDAMLRGHEDEILARELYSEKIAPVTEVGFITNSKWGFTIGYSPDGLVGDDGLIEVKSRAQKYQSRTLIECLAEQIVPEEYMLQIQTGLLVSERDWCDFISYSAGMPMLVIRAHADPDIHEVIIEASAQFEARMAEAYIKYQNAVSGAFLTFPTERKEHEEEIII